MIKKRRKSLTHQTINIIKCFQCQTKKPSVFNNISLFQSVDGQVRMVEGGWHDPRDGGEKSFTVLHLTALHCPGKEGWREGGGGWEEGRGGSWREEGRGASWREEGRGASWRESSLPPYKEKSQEQAVSTAVCMPLR